MNIKKLLHALAGERLDLCTKGELLAAIDDADLVLELDSGHLDTLRACHAEGPLFDGDLPSKAHRNDLLEVGAIAKVVVKGEQGYNACTYHGSTLLRALEVRQAEGGEE